MTKNYKLNLVEIAWPRRPHRPGYSVYCREGTTDNYIAKEIAVYESLNLGKEDVVLDAGAHIGTFALWSLKFGVKKVVSIEPHPENFQILTKNATELGKGKIKCIEAAVIGTSRPKVIDLYLPTRHCFARSSILPYRNRETAKVNTISIYEIMGKHRPTTLKFDIQGAEYRFMDMWFDIPSYVDKIAMEIHYFKPGLREKGLKVIKALQDQGFLAVKRPRTGEKLWHTVGVWRR